MTAVSSSSRQKQTRFRLTIKQPEAWKLRAIAALKRRNYLSAQSSSTSAQAPASSSTTTAPNATATAAVVSGNTSSRKSSSESSKKESRPETALSQKQGLIERSWKELEYWNSRSVTAKERIASLHSVKSSLLWLLKKSTLHHRVVANDYPPTQNSM